MSNYGKGDNRCGVCGGRMRLVNGTWINNFHTPEASLYDSSISNRSAVPAGARTSAQELMCTCCGLRAPVGYTAPASVEKKEKKEKKVKEPLTKKQIKKRKQRIKNIIKLIVLLLILAAIAVVAYKYREVLKPYAYKAWGLLKKAKDLLVRIIK